MMTRRHATLACAAVLTGFAAEKDARGRVRICRVPDGGIQPQAMLDDKGTVHLVYYTGDAHAGRLFYAVSKDYGARFTAPVAVNRESNAIAAGTIRGAQLALGKSGRVHVAWNGSNNAGSLNPDSGKPGQPMLYTRMNNAGNAFEPEWNLMIHSFGLDGGGSIAADRSGNIIVTWHGIAHSEATGTGKKGEARRRMWVRRSDDDGATFAEESRAWAQETGACGCCGMKTFASRNKNVYALYRSATESVHRDIYLLWSADHGKSFQGKLLHQWNVNACPMSSMGFAENANNVIAAWETGGQVYWARITGSGAGEPVAAPGEGKGRKHPRVAINQNGEILFVWTEGTGWQKGGSFAYQIYDRSGRPSGPTTELPGIPTWSFAAAIARPDGDFSIII
jgi:hypothetical protein